MKKKIIACLFACAMALTFAMPVMATDVTVAAPVDVVTEVEQEVAPFSEMTQIVFRTYGGVLQFRVWSITNGRWLTPWTNV